jgi:hypothetical protein
MSDSIILGNIPNINRIRIKLSGLIKLFRALNIIYRIVFL